MLPDFASFLLFHPATRLTYTQKAKTGPSPRCLLPDSGAASLLLRLLSELPKSERASHKRNYGVGNQVAHRKDEIAPEEAAPGKIQHKMQEAHRAEKHEKVDKPVVHKKKIECAKRRSCTDNFLQSNQIRRVAVAVWVNRCNISMG